MTAKLLLAAVLYGGIDIEQCGTAHINNDYVTVAGLFPVADECEVKPGEYFYIYIEDEHEMKVLEECDFKRPFDYAFPIRESEGYIGLFRFDD